MKVWSLSGYEPIAITLVNGTRNRNLTLQEYKKQWISKTQSESFDQVLKFKLPPIDVMKVGDVEGYKITPSASL